MYNGEKLLPFNNIMSELRSSNYADFASKIGCHGKVSERSRKKVRSLIYDQIMWRKQGKKRSSRSWDNVSNDLFINVVQKTLPLNLLKSELRYS